MSRALRRRNTACRMSARQSACLVRRIFRLESRRAWCRQHNSSKSAVGTALCGGPRNGRSMTTHGTPQRAFPTEIMLSAARCCFSIAGAWLALAATAWAQTPWHYYDKSDLPPGVIGQRQLQRGGPLPGYFQPVEVTAPAGTLVSVVSDGAFTEPRPAKLLAGMLIGQVYRLKVANLPNHEGQEVFPTIEIIDRLYPPPGQAARFPIPIELTAEELIFALHGR